MYLSNGMTVYTWEEQREAIIAAHELMSEPDVDDIESVDDLDDYIGATLEWKVQETEE